MSISTHNIFCPRCGRNGGIEYNNYHKAMTCLYRDCNLWDFISYDEFKARFPIDEYDYGKKLIEDFRRSR